jgi:two-component system nitrate/nitrite response regulator NarL
LLCKSYSYPDRIVLPGCVCDSLRQTSLDRLPRVIVAAQGGLFSEGLAALLEARGRHVAQWCHNASDALAWAARLRPAVLLMDGAVPGFPPCAVLRSTLGQWPAIGLVLLADALDPSSVALATAAGARGLVLKSATVEMLIGAIDAVAEGQAWVDDRRVADFEMALYRRHSPGQALPATGRSLTHRQREIVAAVVAAQSNKDIAGRFGISETTVKHHLTDIFDKLRVSSRLELARLAGSGLVDSRSEAPSRWFGIERRAASRGTPAALLPVERRARPVAV